MTDPNQPFRQMLGGLGTLAASSLFRSAVANWWITAPLGYVAYTLIRDRQQKKQLTMPNVINDLVPMVTLVASLVTLNYILKQQESAQPMPAFTPQKPPLGPIKDAAFTPTQKPAPLPGLPVGS